MKSMSRLYYTHYSLVCLTLTPSTPHAHRDLHDADKTPKYVHLAKGRGVPIGMASCLAGCGFTPQTDNNCLPISESELISHVFCDIQRSYG